MRSDSCNCPFKSPGKRLFMLLAASTLLLTLNAYIIVSGLGASLVSTLN
ncbi:MAG: hypothetical protein U9R74_07010 [Pseudomonadota bacterium]|nr:hypothetical protein [Pseudomonadota bacterium]